MDSCNKPCPIAPFAAHGGAPAFKPGIKIEMTLGFSPGSWSREIIYADINKCVELVPPSHTYSRQ